MGTLPYRNLSNLRIFFKKWGGGGICHSLPVQRSDLSTRYFISTIFSHSFEGERGPGAVLHNTDIVSYTKLYRERHKKLRVCQVRFFG